MTITALSGFVSSGSTFADCLQNSNSETQWYKIWDQKSGQFYTQGASTIDGNWVSADSLSQMTLPYDQNKFYITAWGPENGQSEWVDFVVSIGNTDSAVGLSDQTFDAYTNVTYDQIIDTNGLDTDAYLRVYNPDESLYLDVSGDGWVKADELNNYSFETGAAGETTQIWFDTWLSGDGQSGWEDVKIYSEGSSNTESPEMAGEIVSHTTDEYIWYSYIPKSISLNETTHIYLDTSGGWGNTYEDIVQNTKSYTEDFTSYAEKYGVVLLFPAIPRTFEPNHLYPNSLNIDAFTTDNEFYLRPDIRVKQMVDNLQEDLNNQGYTIDEDIFLGGSSQGGMWANRYAYLYPEDVEAVALGQAGGALTLPIEGEDIYTWPLGVNNFSELTGFDFNINSYLEIPHFIFIGSEDTQPNNDAARVDNFDVWTKEQVEYINSNFGDSPPKRLQNMAEELSDAGVSVKFKLYENLGHVWTHDMKTDMFDFFDQNATEEMQTLGFFEQGSDVIDCLI